MRYAIYYTPGQTDPLARIAADWLGRDAFSGEPQTPPAVSQLSPAEISYHTASARRYGFHATLKAPFRLADGLTERELDDAVSKFAADTRPIPLDSLVPTRLDGFLALTPGTPSAELQSFAGDVVTQFDRFRAPLTETEIQRRSPNSLKPDQFRNLMQWGYPYVFDNFRFHMTLTGRVSEQELPKVRAAIDEVFGEALARPIAIDGLALFVEPEPGAPFLVRSWYALGGHRERKTA